MSVQYMQCFAYCGPQHSVRAKLPHYILAAAAAAACLCSSASYILMPSTINITHRGTKPVLQQFDHPLRLTGVKLLLCVVSTWTTSMLWVLYSEPCIYNFLFWTPTKLVHVHVDNTPVTQCVRHKLFLQS